MDIVDDLRKDPYEEERQYKREARLELGGILDKAADEIVHLREYKSQSHKLEVLFVEEIKRLRRGLHQIASIERDPDFGALPISDAQKIAQDTLEDE